MGCDSQTIESAEGTLGLESDISEVEQVVTDDLANVTKLFEQRMQEAQKGDTANPYFMDGEDADPNFPCTD